MSRVQLRLPLGLGHRLREIVFAPGVRETIAFCLVSHFQQGNETVLLARELVEMPDGDYLSDGPHGAAWRGTAMLPVLHAAVASGLGILLVHAHDFPSPARLSYDDLNSARRLVPMFRARVPERAHGSIVLARGTAAGFLALPGKEPTLVESIRVRWLGKASIEWPIDELEHRLDSEVFDRQALVVGRQSSLADANVVVVGLCGGGGHAVQQFAHLGIGTVVGIDDDESDKTNLHRGIGMRRRDGVDRTPKIDVMERMVRAIGSGTKFVGVRAKVPAAATIEAIRNADVVVGCVDGLHARASILEIAWRNLVPYVDVGVSIRPLEGSVQMARVSVGGNVHVFIPGGFCGWCCGFLSEEKLRAERDGRDDPSYFRGKKGEAQVVSLNGTVASQAVTEALQLLTGFRGVSVDPGDLETPDGRQRGALKLDGLRGTMDEWGARRRLGCPVCDAVLGAGSVVWRAAS